ncbi:MAG: carbohydrate ABC transporter permease [Candidatus Microthrix sp.]|jgi:sn-glycerol 3-phosphate transport system permease protein|nr:carbohydrate ABC transporter permease [Candidatus Microthrix sp.]MBK7165512.1 carbohydrate ABC transporter permease [Candidatus Microthrix sp.]
MANESSATRRRTRVSVAGWYLLLTGLSLIILFPVWMTIVRALSEPFIYIEEGQPLYPVSIDWGVFSTAWSDGDLGRSMALTLLVTAIITVFQLVTSVLAAYSFAFVRFPFKNTLFILLLASLLLPVEVTLIANVRTIRELGWLDSAQGLSAPFLASAFGIFLIRQGFLGVPSELRDAARIDGFGHFAFLRRVAIPVNRPIIASLTLITALAAWNQYLWPRTATTQERWETIQVTLRSISVQRPERFNVGVAAAIIASLPILALLVVFQRQIIRGLTAGAVKG